MDLIEEGDVCSLIFLLLLLTAVGLPFVAQAPALHNLGLRIAAGWGLLYAILRFSEQGIGGSAEIAVVVLQSSMAGGLILGPSWIVLGVGGFFWNRCNQMIRATRARVEARRSECERMRSEGRERERRRLAEEEWERTRPQRELAAREAAERAQFESETTQQKLLREADNQKRREEARLRCLLAYDKWGPSLSRTFPRERLDQYFETYLTDVQSPEVVEARSLDLIQILESCAQQYEGRRQSQFQSLADLAAFYEQQRRLIEGLGYEPDVVDTLKVTLATQEDAALREFLMAARQ